jgi:hypothetical protein
MWEMIALRIFKSKRGRAKERKGEKGNGMARRGVYFSRASNKTFVARATSSTALSKTA